MSANGGPGREGATLSFPPGRRLRAVAFAPAVRGYPGGIADMAADLDDLTPGETFADDEVWAPAEDVPVAAEVLTGQKSQPGGGAGPAQPVSVWQQSLAAWQEAGIEWLGPEAPGMSQATADDGPHTEPIPVVPAIPAAGSTGDAAAAAAGGSTGQVTPDRSGGSSTGQASRDGAGGSSTGQASRDGAGRDGAGGDGAGGAARAGRRRRAAIAVAAVVLVLVAGTLAGIAVAGSGSGGRPAGPAFAVTTPLPPAALADASFSGQSAGSAPLLAALAGVAAAGRTVVAVGSQPSQPAPVPLMLVSTDGGRAWARAALAVPGSPPIPGAGTLPGGGTVPGPPSGTGALPTMIARGGSGWLALGQQAAWTSPDGRTWQPAPGIPAQPGDSVASLAGTGGGFVAVGGSTGARPGPVVWTSANGRAWQRRSGAALRLTAKGGHVMALRWVASRGGAIVAAGVLSGPGHPRVPAGQASGLWRSTDGGRTWDQVTLPASHGATGAIAGLATSGAAFLAIRPGRTSGGRQDALAYLSTQGSSWRYAGRLAPHRHASIRVTAVSGSGHGFAVAAATRTAQVAFASTGGRGWHQTPGPGTGLAGLTAVPGGGVVAAGDSGRGAGRARPHLYLLGAGTGRRQVGQAVLASAATPDVTVNGLAGAAGTQVAVGAAAGAPAVWVRSPAAGQAPAAMLLPAPWRNGALASVAHGPRGWLAVGQAGPQGTPVVVTSATGTSWAPGPGTQALTAPPARLAQTAAGPSGYVVVGSTVTGGRPAAAAWFSPDLRTLARAAVAAASGPGQMLAVTALRSGFVAVGSAGGAPAAWLSRTGSAWQAAPLPRPAGVSAAVLTTVAATGGRVVAAGYETRAGAAPVPFTAVSANGGRTWREPALRAPRGPVTVTALAAAGRGFAAVGHAGVPGRQALVCWWSPDGLTWHYAEAGGGGPRAAVVQQINALIAATGTLTGIGYAAGPSGEHPIAWHARYR